jgi:hypothetical protein
MAESASWKVTRLRFRTLESLGVLRALGKLVLDMPGLALDLALVTSVGDMGCCGRECDDCF